MFRWVPQRRRLAFVQYNRGGYDSRRCSLSAMRRVKAMIAGAMLTMAFATQGCLPENYYADLAASSIAKIVDASITAVIDCLTPDDSTGS